MAKNKVTIDIEVNGKMQKATVGVNKLKKALRETEQAQKQLSNTSRDGYRAQQGVAQNTANGTKAFAKQAGTVRGIVPIYATFAANVFAITAAFGALRRAAAVEQLTSSLEKLGAVAGRNLPALAQDLRDITDSAISTEQALRATSVAVSAGFSSSQLKELTKVAKGASLALGRDLGDALDRLVRGTAKLEPEILDELGIIVRLDDATREYATSLGKTAQELTQFERQQAFLNATITQGLSKYEKIAQAIDPNPYDQLSAAFDNLSKTLINFANSALTPIVKFFAQNELALSGALVLFGSTLVRQVVPAIDEVIRRQQILASTALQMSRKEGKRFAVVYQKGFDAVAASAAKLGDKLPKATAALLPALEKGNLGLKEQANLNRSLGVAITARAKAAKAASGARKAELQAEIALLKQLKLEIASVETATTRRFVASSKGARLQAQSRIAKRSAGYSQAIDNAGIFGGFGVALQGAKKQIGEIDKAAKKGAVGVQKLRVAASAATSAFGLFGRATLNLIPGIGQLLFFGSLLLPLFQKFFGLTEEEAALKEVTKRFDIFGKTVALIEKELETMGDTFGRITSQLKAKSGAFDEIAAGIRKIGEAADEANIEKLNAAIEDQLSAQRQIALSTQAIQGGVAGEGAFISLLWGQRGLENAKEAIDLAESAIGTISKGNALAVITAAEAKLGRASGLLNAGKELSKLKKLLDTPVSEGGFLTEAGTIDYALLARGVDQYSQTFGKLGGELKSAGDQLSRFNQEQTKLQAKRSTPFSEIIGISGDFGRTVSSVINELDTTGGLGGFAGGLNIREGELAKQNPEFAKQADFLSRIYNLSVKISSLGTLKLYSDKFTEEATAANDILINKVSIQKQEEQQLKALQRIQEGGVVALEAQFAQEVNVLAAKKSALEAQKDLNAKFLEGAELTAKNAEIDRQISNLAYEKTSQAEQEFQITKARIAEDQRALDILNKEVSLNRQSLDIEQRKNDLRNDRLARQERSNSPFAFLGADERAAQRELQNALDLQKSKEDSIKKEAEAKRQQIEIEYALLDAKYEYLAAELDAAADKANDGSIEGALRKEALENRANDLRSLVGDPNGLKGRALELVDADETLKIDELGNSIENLKEKLRGFTVEKQIVDAAAKSFADGFGDAFSSILEGTKSVKDAFGDLATSVLRSIQKVIFDRITQKFVNFLFGDPTTGGGGALGGIFGGNKEEAPTGQGPAAAAASAMPGMNSTGVLGSSAMTPMYVCVVACPDGAMGVPGIGTGTGTPGIAGPVGMAGSAGAAMVENSGYELGPTKDEEEQSKKGLIDGLKSLDTATLASTAAVTGLLGGVLGNTKAGEALQKVSMALQAVILAQTIWDKFIQPMQSANTAANTAALAANTVALTASSAFGFARTGGVFSGGAKVKGYSEGGVASGRQGGYPALLHGTEAVVPLPNGRSIPVEMSSVGSGGGMQENNVSVNVVMNGEGNAESTNSKADSAEAASMGKKIAAAVQNEIRNQKRSGGMLSPYGVA